MRTIRSAMWPLVSLVVMTCLIPCGRGAEALPIDRTIDFSGQHSGAVQLTAGQTIEISAGFPSPSQLPANGRVAVEWKGPEADDAWRKVLHALDPDIYLVYRAPRA